MPAVDIVNASTVVSDADLSAMIPALQIQVSRDFAPTWGRTARLNFVPNGGKPSLNHWWLAVLDNSDVAGALGYHDVTNAGKPLGKVFAATDLQYGDNVSVTLSHELLEMLGDPNISLCVQHGTRLWAYEACDAVEADADGYEIDGIRVSNFILPSWFEAFIRQTKYDFLGQLTAPRTLRPGGYCSVLDFDSGAGWQQLTAATNKAPMVNGRISPGDAERVLLSRPRVGSRRERRRMPQAEWFRSRVQDVEAEAA